MAQSLQPVPYMERNWPEKRIVFEHTQGPHQGLKEIMGLGKDMGAGPILPTSAEGFEAQERVIEFASLVRVERTYILFREALRNV